MLNLNSTSFAFLLILLFSGKASFSQCCSAGSPVGASTNVGVLDKGILNINSFYRYSQHNNYFQGKDELKDFGYIDYTFFNYISLMSGYGITYKTTIEADMGFFINKTQKFKLPPGYELKGTGFSSGTVSIKRALFKNTEKNTEITGGAGIRFPFSTESKYYNNVLLPVEIQPSTGSFGGILHLFAAKSWHNNERRLFTYNRFEYNLENKNNYQYGWALINSVFYSHKIIKNLIAAGEIRNETRQYDLRNKARAANTGSHVIVFSPRIMYSIAGKWTISLLYDTPVYRFYSGRQMGLYQSVAFNFSRQVNIK